MLFLIFVWLAIMESLLSLSIYVLPEPKPMLFQAHSRTNIVHLNIVSQQSKPSHPSLKHTN